VRGGWSLRGGWQNEPLNAKEPYRGVDRPISPSVSGLPGKLMGNAKAAELINLRIERPILHLGTVKMVNKACGSLRPKRALKPGP